MSFDVVCVGSATIDTFMTSSSVDVRIDEKSVSLPIGAKILLDTVVTDVGGSGVNTSISFSRLGLRTAFLGKLGNDAPAQTILRRLEKEGVTALKSKAAGKTGCSFILSGLHHDRTILTYKGSSNALSTNDVPWKNLAVEWIYMGTLFGKGWKTQEKIAQFAKRKGINLVFNPSLYLAEQGVKKLAPVLSASNILILNKEEAQSLLKSNGAVSQLLKGLHRFVPLAVITDGPRGAHAFDGKKAYYARAHHLNVLDPTGAGDAFASGFLAAHIYGKNISECLRWGITQAESILVKFGATNDLLTKKKMGGKAC